MDQKKLKSTYRHFVRYGLRAVGYKAPQRYVIIELLRKRFRTSHPLISEQAIENTKEFIVNAALYEGMESRIINNMVHVEYGRRGLRAKMIAAEALQGRRQVKKQEYDQYSRAYNAFDLIVKNLNDSMTLCL